MRVNPFVWLHLRLTSGVRMTLLTPLILAGVVLVASTSTISSASQTDRPMVVRTWITLISLGQAVLLFILAPAGIRKAVLRDMQTGMIESHRIAPLSDLKITLGYLIGPAIQSLLLFAATLPFSLYFLNELALGGLTAAMLVGWWAALACLLVAALMNAAAVLLNALSTGGKGNIVTAGVIGATMGGLFIIRIVPGLALVAGVMSGGEIYRALFPAGGGKSDPLMVLTTAILQFAVALVCIAAAARKVRAPRQPAFSLPLGGLFVIVTGAAMLIGLAAMSNFSWMFGNSSLRDRLTQVVASGAVFYLAGLIPVVTAARIKGDARQVEKLVGATPRRVPAGLELVPALAALLTFGMLAWELFLASPAVGWPDYSQKLGPNLLIVLALLASAWTDFQVCVAFALRGWSVARGLIYALVLFKAVPPLLDVVVWLFGDDDRRRAPVELYFAAGSPFGLVSVAHQNFEVGLVGFGVQLLFAALATLFAGFSRVAPFVHPPGHRPAGAGVPIDSGVAATVVR